MEGYEENKKHLEECNQAHILKYWPTLTHEQQRSFLNQMLGIDFKEACSMWRIASNNERQPKITADRIEPVFVKMEKSLPLGKMESYRSHGMQAIANGLVAVVALAGKQGSNLGMSYPVGICPTDLPSGKTVFQIQAERILKLQQLVVEHTGKDGILHWYIMTSPATHLITKKFFIQNKYFNLKPENVTFFEQGQLPCFDNKGKILLEEKDQVAMAADGNGGIYRALKKQGIFDHMDKKGIKYLNIYGIDNMLVKIADPLYIGKCIKDEIECGVKVVKKTNPTECVGIVAKVDDEVRVVEYHELPTNVSSLKSVSKLNLVYRYANISNYFFTVDFLKTIAYQHESDLNLHIVRKVFAYVSNEGDKVRVAHPSGGKIERFIFDSLSYSKRYLLWKVERSEEFAPIKYSDLRNKDCFRTAKDCLLTLHKKWIEQIGGKCKGTGVEISPLISYWGENLGCFKGQEFTDGEVILSETEKSIIR